MTRDQLIEVLQPLQIQVPNPIVDFAWIELRRYNEFGVIVRISTDPGPGMASTKIRFYSNGRFERQTVKGPWLQNQYQSWCNTNRVNGFPGSQPGYRRLIPDRHSEGELLDIDCSSCPTLEDFRNWLRSFLTTFVDGLPNQWTQQGLQWNVAHSDVVQPYVTIINGPARDANPPRPATPAPNNTERSINNEIRQLLESNRQVILFGAPGTGKSFALKSDYEGENASFRDRHARVTFYPTYSYSQFVGTYKPVMKQVGDESKIAYEFVPGPLLRMLVKAANDPDKDHNNYLLIIEEINRANAAAVFGDFFQLLDRDSDGRSEYPIAAGRDVVRYLAGTDDDGNPILNDTGRQFFGMDGSSCTLSFPKNLYLHATMNSADQGVFPMDTAFKRRWEFGYVAIDEDQRKCEDENWTIGEKNYRWNAVRKLVNRLLSLRGVNEDKLMGPFFVKPETGGTTVSANQFKSKVLMYLWEDAARMCRRTIFGSNIKTYSELLDAWNASGVNLFEAGDANLGDQGDANARALYRRIVNPTQEIPPLEPPAGVVPEPPESEVVTPGGVAG